MLTASPIWSSLQAHAARLKTQSLRELFAADERRFTRFSAQGAGMLFDFSKNLIDNAALDALLAWAEHAQWQVRRDALLRGDPVNTTEGRAAWHTALRWPVDRAQPQVREVLQRMADFSTAVREGVWTNANGQPMTDIVNIGIGGSDLGPRMACDALQAFAHPRLHMHFVSNIDGHDLQSTLARLNPHNTLFIIASKSFTTEETLANAHSARRWFLEHGGRDVERHFVAVSTHREAVTEFGIDAHNMFPFWDWVGGRYSLWSAIGLPLMLSIGPAHFEEFLAGAYAMDTHFAHASARQNLPVLLACMEVWGRNFMGYTSHNIAPYHHGLRRFPAYLQQLEMESNGKAVQSNGLPAECSTSAVLWGEPGTNGQHAFFQMLHQGTDIIPVDFIGVAQATHDWPDQHQRLLAHCLAQSQALAFGKTTQEVVADMRAAGLDEAQITQWQAHRTFPGNRPSNTLILSALTPHTLGSLIALYEHKVFICGVLWNINSFDQWGVELGKILAQRIYGAMHGQPHALDASTAGLLAHLQVLASTSSSESRSKP